MKKVLAILWLVLCSLALLSSFIFGAMHGDILSAIFLSLLLMVAIVNLTYWALDQL